VPPSFSVLPSLAAGFFVAAFFAAGFFTFFVFGHVASKT
jgi:hypothetical protein